MTYTSSRDTHDCEIKVRLTEADERTLADLARRNGLPRAVLARMFILRSLRAGCGLASDAALADGRPA